MTLRLRQAAFLLWLVGMATLMTGVVHFVAGPSGQTREQVDARPVTQVGVTLIQPIAAPTKPGNKTLFVYEGRWKGVLVTSPHTGDFVEWHPAWPPLLADDVTITADRVIVKAPRTVATFEMKAALQALGWTISDTTAGTIVVE
jgi:hypothetical protein